MSYLASTRYQATAGGPDEQAPRPDPNPPTRRRLRMTKSEFFDRPLADPAIATLVDRLATGWRPGQDRNLLFAPWGGAYNRRPPDITAFAHRDQLFLLEHLVQLPADGPGADRRSARDWVRDSWAAVHPFGSGRVYPNFADPGLVDSGRAYYGENYSRL